ncbi:MAG: peptide chain release factor N(5)-glutamine methyltransferase [Bacteroidales bacterium]|nr:peptide chain release factor N(5)-glutamine methyltransferase [Bacteroidales bacterium]MCF8404705.1 peptide chain release factor N(5)-glutamine methyltransferase [Bacteroidales bacterium]
MEVRSNRIGDIRKHYFEKLVRIFSEKEAEALIFLVLMEYTGLTKVEILIRPEATVSESELLKIHFAVKELLKEKPIQYVLGKTEFYGIPLIVNSRVLIPRPETEELVEIVIKNTPNLIDIRILDIGTGSGCIAIALKKNLPDTKITAVDVSDFALGLATQNAEINETKIEFQHLDILEPKTWVLKGTFNVIVSNPPYVRESEKKGMNKNVLEYEPGLALFVPDEDPLIYYRRIMDFAKLYLIKGGNLYFEINQYLSSELLLIIDKDVFEDIEIHKDFKDNYRILSCVRKNR